MKIYLDQNKWIDLARSIIKPNEYSDYVEVAKVIKIRADAGEWIFPISVIHFMETLSRSDIGSRKRLADVISSISGNTSILPFMDVEPLEFINSFAEIHGQDDKKVQIKAVQSNLLPAIGADKISVEVDSSVSEYIRSEIVSFVEKFNKDENLFSLLMSNTDDSKLIEETKQDDEDARKEWTKLRERFSKIPKEYKYNVFLIESFCSQFMLFKNTLMERFNKNREEIIPPTILSEKEKTIELLESIPSLDVRVKLMYEVLKNEEQPVHIHDHRDVAFLSTAIPYCDVVITERTWKHHANLSKLGAKYSTEIENDLNFLLTLA